MMLTPQQPTGQEDLMQLSFNFTSIINTHVPGTNTSIKQSIFSFFRQKAEDSFVLGRRKAKDITQQLPDLQVDFSDYLDSVSEQLTTYRRYRSKKHIVQQFDAEFEAQYRNNSNMPTDLEQDGVDPETGVLQCFELIPYSYFQKDFVPNFQSYSLPGSRVSELAKLNDHLDKVEINLFKQVTLRFNDFFSIMENLETLNSGVNSSIERLAQAREKVAIVKGKWLQRGLSIQKRIRERKSKQNLLKYMLVIRSLRKLPPTLNSILESSLPYEGIGLLASGKESYKLVKELQSLKPIGKTLENGDSIIKHSLYKTFSDKLFLYLTQPLSKPYKNRLQEVPTVHALQSTANPNETVIQEQASGSFTTDHTAQELPRTNTQTETEIVKLITESFWMVDFTNNTQLRVKIMEYLKIVSKSFLEEVRFTIAKVLKQKSIGSDSNIITCSSDQNNSNRSSSLLSELNGSNQDSSIAEHPTIRRINSKQEQEFTDQNTPSLESLVDKISLSYFGKLMLVYHDSLKTLVTRLNSLTAQLVRGLGSCKQPEAGKSILDEFLTLLSNISKFICDKVISFLSLKRLNQETTIDEFNHFLLQLVTWEQYVQNMFKLSPYTLESKYFKDQIVEAQSKLEQAFSTLRLTKQQLQTAYISNLHKNVLSHELKSSLQQDTWQAVEEIPYHYMTMFGYIFNGQELPAAKDLHTSVNQSGFLDFSRRQSSHSHSAIKYSRRVDRQVDFKLVKNALIVQKTHYKLTVSLLLFVEVLEEYLKFVSVYPETKEDMLTRISEITKFYSALSFQLIVGAGALKYERIKTKNITARHLCLSRSCIKVVILLIHQFSEYAEVKSALVGLQQHCSDILKKLSTIMVNKIENEITQLQNLGNGLKNSTAATKHTISIVNVFKQLMEIMEEYLTEEEIKEVLKPAVNVVVKRYFAHLQSLGKSGKEEGKYFVEQMQVLELTFEKQYAFMRSLIV